MPKPYSALAFFALLLGFLLLLSKVPILIVLGVLLVFWGLLAPFFENWLQLIFHQTNTRVPGQNQDAPQPLQADADQTTPGQNQDAPQPLQADADQTTPGQNQDAQQVPQSDTGQTLPGHDQELSEIERHTARIQQRLAASILLGRTSRSEFLEQEYSQALLNLATAREERARAEILNIWVLEREEFAKALANILSKPAEPEQQKIEEETTKKQD